jgi:hypothetical protein
LKWQNWCRSDSQTVDHIEAACDYGINLIPRSPQRARWRFKALGISARRKEKSVRTGLSPKVQRGNSVCYCRQNITQGTRIRGRPGDRNGSVISRFGDKSGWYSGKLGWYAGRRLIRYVNYSRGTNERGKPT